jgi:hypothetical protein
LSISVGRERRLVSSIYLSIHLQYSFIYHVLYYIIYMHLFVVHQHVPPASAHGRPSSQSNAARIGRADARSATRAALPGSRSTVPVADRRGRARRLRTALCPYTSTFLYLQHCLSPSPPLSLYHSPSPCFCGRLPTYPQKGSGLPTYLGLDDPHSALYCTACPDRRFPLHVRCARVASTCAASALLTHAPCPRC